MTAAPLRRILLGVAVVAAAGCSPLTDSQPHEVADDAVPFDLLSPDAPSLIRETTGVAVTVCLVGNDLLVPVTRTLEGPVKPADLLRSLSQDVSDAEAQFGLRTALTDAAAIARVRVRAGTAQVDLERIPRAGGGTSTIAVAQIVCTLTSQPGIGLVAFRVDGAPVQVPRADGSLADGPVSRDDFEALIVPGGEPAEGTLTPAEPTPESPPAAGG